MKLFSFTLACFSLFATLSVFGFADEPQTKDTVTNPPAPQTESVTEATVGYPDQETDPLPEQMKSTSAPTAAAAPAPAPVSPECLSAQNEMKKAWDEYYACRDKLEEELDAGKQVDQNQCESKRDAINAKEALMSDPYGACPNLVKGNFSTFFFGPDLRAEAGYTSAEGGGAVLRIVLSPLAGLNPRNVHPEEGTSLEILTVDFGLRWTAGRILVDTVKIDAGRYEKFIMKNVGVQVSDRFVTDSNRGQFYNNLDGKVILNLLSTAYTSLYPGKHINIGAGARFQMRHFYILRDEAQGGPSSQGSYNLQVPVSLDVAYTFLQGKITLAAVVEYAINPFRTRDQRVGGKVEARYNLKTAYKDQSKNANYMKYRIDVGARYEIDYQKELASDFGATDRLFIGDHTIHRGLGFIEVAF